LSASANSSDIRELRDGLQNLPPVRIGFRCTWVETGRSDLERQGGLTGHLSRGLLRQLRSPIGAI